MCVCVCGGGGGAAIGGLTKAHMQTVALQQCNPGTVCRRHVCLQQCSQLGTELLMCACSSC
jgi:hypothetical protein